MILRIAVLISVCGSLGCGSLATVPTTGPHTAAAVAQQLAAEHGEWSGRQRYVAHLASKRLTIDGRLDEPAWEAAASTAPFVDIEGEGHHEPRHQTTAKMLWDADYFYVGATLEEPHLWSTLTERDSVIFKDNDFEVFIDPDGDTHQYYELEINALGTEWDLLLARPYRDGGPAINGFDTAGLRSAVALVGTINDPSDRDVGWSVEIAIPWSALAEIAGCPVPPRDGDVWWVNFSRVQWRLDVVASEGGSGQSYVKRLDGEGEALPEDNWVWSPQGVIAMHEPESWGLVLFAEDEATKRKFIDPIDLRQREALHRIYKAQHALRKRVGHYSSSLEELGLARDELNARTLELFTTPSGFEAVLFFGETESALHIDQSGHLW